jgi:hypothetical protein
MILEKEWGRNKMKNFDVKNSIEAFDEMAETDCEFFIEGMEKPVIGKIVRYYGGEYVKIVCTKEDFIKEQLPKGHQEFFFLNIKYLKYAHQIAKKKK